MSQEGTTTSVPSLVFGRSEFICSKPLQALHCASIVRHYRIRSAGLTIVTQGISEHEDFQEFFRLGRHGQLFERVESVPTHVEAAESIRSNDYQSLFVEDDRVSMYLLLVPLRRDRMILYEEGFGTYRGPYESNMHGLKRIKWKALARLCGCGFKFGSGRKTDVIMVTRPDVFKRLNPELGEKVRAFPGIADELQREPAWTDLLVESLGLDRRNRSQGTLVLGPWGGLTAETRSEVERLRSGDLFYKPHPHDGRRIRDIGAHMVGPPWVPAEVTISALANHYDYLKVIHFSSSAVFYTRNCYDESHVEFLNVTPVERYAKIMRLAHS